MPPLPIINHHGWHVQLWYKGKAGGRKYKPGWYADVPGSTFRFELNTSFPEARGQPAEVRAATAA